MNYPVRTAVCKKCGEVKFKIVPKFGEIDYVCIKCGTTVGTVQGEEYTSVRSICDKCKTDIFKVRIEEDNGTEYWDGYCINCNSEPKRIIVNREMQVINRKTLERLKMLDKIDSLEGTIEKLTDKIEDLENNLIYIESYSEQNRQYIYGLQEENSDIRSDVRSVNSDISDLERKIRYLE